MYIVAELLRNKQDDIRWNNGKLCYAPVSRSYWLGIAALCCLALSQLLANFIFFNPSLQNPQFHIPVVAKLLVFISWVCCGVGIVILTVAISMTGEQNYGEGWLEGDCYVVKPGCFVASSILLLLSLASISASSFSTFQIHPH
ncbi:hypothetical protein K1719_034118 [Acacia pycnantha]|nr:hypothetical protein K1719_034118 [Acacia pycnantha]